MVFLGDDTLRWLVLALGGAMAVGHILALTRPRPPGRASADLPRPPMVRSLIMIALGTLASIWALASLVAG